MKQRKLDGTVFSKQGEMLVEEQLMDSNEIQENVETVGKELKSSDKKES